MLILGLSMIAHPNEVKNYLGYMAEHFTLAINPTPDDVSGKDKEWLSNYAKALRNMTEKVIDVIKAKRSLTKEQRHDALCEVSNKVLDHLNACDKNILEKLEEKARLKLNGFINDLRKNENKVALVEAYENTKFFTQLAGNINKATPTEKENYTFSAN